MHKSIIDQLQNVHPEERVDIINKLYIKNVQYFSEKHPAISHILNNLAENPFQLNLTDNFLEIIDAQNGEKCHPDIGLDHFARSLGDWTHNAWVDFLQPQIPQLPLETWHRRKYQKFVDVMLEKFPGINQRQHQGTVNLPRTGSQRRFSSSVVFAGIFHGLHIAHFLSRTDINSVTFIEPNPFRFEVSCYFLDYEVIGDLSDGLLIHVGEGLPHEFVDIIIRKGFVTNHVWMRVLPAYASEKIEPIINQIRMRWLALSDTWVAADRELKAISNGVYNLKKKQLLLVKKPKLSRYSRIAVIGAGPSLSEDLDWLKKNQEKLIIFASHTSVRKLKDENILPDFQFSLDLDFAERTYEKLRLDTDIPFVVTYQINPKLILDFKHILMVAGETIASPARIFEITPFMYPTTGNMAFALAHYFQPTDLYLLGLDFGFRSTEQIHVAGSHFDFNTSKIESVKGIKQIPVDANFSNQKIFTRPYFNQARSIVEKALLTIPATTRVFNLSDGAMIHGAAATHSSSVKLPAYLMKRTDIASIMSAFDEATVEKHWAPYELSSEDQLQIFKKRCREVLLLDTFSHKHFAAIVDKCQFLINESCKGRNLQDSRMIPYLRVVKDLLVSWYRCMVLTNSVEEAQLVYAEGYKAILDIVDTFNLQDQSHPTL